MATLGELRTDLRIWTATHKNVAVLPDLVCDECINAAIALMQEAHLFRGQETTSIPLPYAANTESIALPFDFVAQRAVYQQTQGGPPVPLLAYIEKTLRGEWLRAEQPSTGLRDPDYPSVAPPGAPLGWPVQYAIWRERLYLLPVPNADLQLVLDYYLRLPPLSDPVRANFFTMRYPHVVRYGGLADAYAYLHEEERAAAYRTFFEAMLARVILDDKNTMLAGGSAERGA
jgi:hypothetical protein